MEMTSELWWFKTLPHHKYHCVVFGTAGWVRLQVGLKLFTRIYKNVSHSWNEYKVLTVILFWKFLKNTTEHTLIIPINWHTYVGRLHWFFLLKRIGSFADPYDYLKYDNEILIVIFRRVTFKSFYKLPPYMTIIIHGPCFWSLLTSSHVSIIITSSSSRSYKDNIDEMECNKNNLYITY